jgi:hypothetical protein
MKVTSEAPPVHHPGRNAVALASPTASAERSVVNEVAEEVVHVAVDAALLLACGLVGLGVRRRRH